MIKKMTPVSLNRDKKSPFYFASFYGADGKQKRRSTKVPAGGGVYEGRRISAAQARSIALRVGVELAGQEEEEYHAADNTTVRQLCDMMLAGKLGRVSMATYENARVDYRQFLSWLGRRADEPARLISRADVKGWIDARRREVRHNTVCKALGAIRAAFGCS